ncbi:hypothetical protein KIPB_009581, partial [Kipferlia bialata]|eukprot:g9581.t1
MRSHLLVLAVLCACVFGYLVPGSRPNEYTVKDPIPMLQGSLESEGLPSYSPYFLGYCAVDSEEE